MDKVIALGAKYRVDVQNKGLTNSYFTDDNYMYYFNVLNTNNNAFGITKVELIKNISEEVGDEIYFNGNRMDFKRNSRNEQKSNDSNNKSVGYQITSNNDVELVRGKQEQQRINEGRQNTTESIGNIKQELDYSSFSNIIEASINEATIYLVDNGKKYYS